MPKINPHKAQAISAQITATFQGESVGYNESRSSTIDDSAFPRYRPIGCINIERYLSDGVGEGSLNQFVCRMPLRYPEVL
ncbi:MAG: hypothetical protein WBZ36_19750, partial [Candidatus Nitrosopolaris sp.]